MPPFPSPSISLLYIWAPIGIKGEVGLLSITTFVGRPFVVGAHRQFVVSEDMNNKVYLSQ